MSSSQEVLSEVDPEARRYIQCWAQRRTAKPWVNREGRPVAASWPDLQASPCWGNINVINIHLRELELEKLQAIFSPAIMRRYKYPLWPVCNSKIYKGVQAYFAAHHILRKSDTANKKVWFVINRMVVESVVFAHHEYIKLIHGPKRCFRHPMKS